MLNIFYSKFLKLSFFMFLAIIFINCFNINTSYAYTFEEFKDYVNEHKSEMTSAMQGRWNYIMQYFDLTTLSTYWKDSNAVTMYMTFDTSGYTYKTVTFNFIYYDYNSGRLYNANNNLNIENKTQNIDTLKVEYNNYSNTTNYTTGNITTPYVASTQMFNNTNSNNNRTKVIVKDRDIYTSTVGETIVTGYNFINNYVINNGFSFIQNTNFNISYTVKDKLLGDFTNVENISDIEAILYQNGKIIAQYGVSTSSSDYSLYISDDYRLYVPTRLIYTGLTYDLLIYDRTTTNSNYYYYNFVLSSGDTGYTNQIGTNDIIQNQNQNTQDVINTIKDSGDFNGIMIVSLGLSGDISSGDTNSIAGQLGYQERQNPWGDFINRMLYDIGEVLMNNEDVDYTLGFHDNRSIVLHSKDFVLTDGPIKVFLNICLTYFIVVILYQEMKKIINKINEGDYIYALNRGDAIEYFYM